MKKMRLFFSLALLLFSGVVLEAQNAHPLTLVVENKDAAKNQVLIVSNIKKITFADGKMKVSHKEGWAQKDKGEMLLSEVVKCRFSTQDAPTKNQAILNKELKLVVANDVLFVRGLEEGKSYNCQIFFTEGKLMRALQIRNGEGIEIRDWNKGLYLVKIENKTLKFVR